MITARYRLDKANAKLLGVCSGLARAADVDVVLVRIALVLATIFLMGPLAILAYVIVAMIAQAE